MSYSLRLFYRLGSYVMIFALVLFTGCLVPPPPEPGPVPIYGNDGATLRDLDLTGALAIVQGQVDPHVMTDGYGESFPNNKTFKIGTGGTYSHLNISFDGNPNGGTENYVAYSLNEKYFILTFHLRRETYIIDKSDGKAYKTAFMGNPSGPVATSKDLYFAELYDATGVRGNPARIVKDFLSESASQTILPDAGQYFVVDENDQLYYASAGHSFRYLSLPTGSGLERVGERGHIWNNHSGKLQMAYEDGRILSVANGVVSEETPLENVVLNSFYSYFRAFTFPDLNKTVVIAADLLNGANGVYDLADGKLKFDLGSRFGITYGVLNASAKGNYLNLIISDGLKPKKLLQIDVTTYTTKEISIERPNWTAAQEFTALNDTEMITWVCEGDECAMKLYYLNMSGKVKQIMPGYDLCWDSILD